MKIIEKIVDITTNEEKMTERDETNEEKILREKLQNEIANQAIFEQTKIEAKASAEAKLSALGLTADEIAALRG